MCVTEFHLRLQLFHRLIPFGGIRLQALDDDIGQAILLARGEGSLGPLAWEVLRNARILVEEKKTGRRKVAYRSDAKGSVNRFPLV
jgi:hypothetical protein